MSPSLWSTFTHPRNSGRPTKTALTGKAVPSSSTQFRNAEVTGNAAPSTYTRLRKTAVTRKSVAGSFTQLNKSAVTDDAVGQKRPPAYRFRIMIENKIEHPKDTEESENAKACQREFVSLPYFEVFMDKLLSDDNIATTYAKNNLGLSENIKQKMFHFCLSLGSRDGIEAENFEAFCNPTGIKLWWRLQESCFGNIAKCTGESALRVQGMIQEYVAPHTRYYASHLPGFYIVTKLLCPPFEPEEYEPGKATRLLESADEAVRRILSEISSCELSLESNNYRQLEESRREAEETLRGYMIGTLFTTFKDLQDEASKAASLETGVEGLETKERNEDNENDGKGDDGSHGADEGADSSAGEDAHDDDEGDEVPVGE